MYNININMDNATESTLNAMISEGILSRQNVDAEIIQQDNKRLASFIELNDYNLYYALERMSINILDYMLQYSHYSKDNRLIKPLIILLLHNNDKFTQLIQKPFIRDLLHRKVGQLTLQWIDSKSTRHINKYKMNRPIDYLYLVFMQYNFNDDFFNKLNTLLGYNYDINYFNQSFRISYLFKYIEQYKREIEVILKHMSINHFDDYIEIVSNKQKVIQKHNISINESIEHDEIDILI